MTNAFSMFCKHVSIKRKKLKISQAWWLLPIIPEPRKLKHEDLNFKPCLRDLARLCLKILKINKGLGKQLSVKTLGSISSVTKRKINEKWVKDLIL